MYIPNLFSCVFSKMNTRRLKKGRVYEEISPQVEKAEQVLQSAEAVQVPIEVKVMRFWWFLLK